MAHTILFLDTNIFMHYQPVDQIRWLRETNSNEVTIVVPPIVINELQRKKDGNAPTRIKKRAGKALKKLYTLFSEESRATLAPNITIIFEDREPSIDFAKYQLNPETGDDNLIASMLMYKSENQQAILKLVTNDDGLTLLAKSRRQNIEVLKLPDNYKLKDDPDPEAQKITELEREIRQLKSRIPKLVLFFEDETNFKKLSIPSPELIDGEKISKEINLIKEKYPFIPIKKSSLDFKHVKNLTVGEALKLEAQNYIPPEFIQIYNNELKQYFVSYEEYLLQQFEFKNLLKSVFTLKIYITNTGTAPAKDIDIFMYFPEWVDVYSSFEHIPSPYEPSPPSKPKLLDIGDLGNFPHIMENFYLSENEPIFEPNVSSNKIKKSAGSEINFHVQNLKHQILEFADPLYLVFPSYEHAKSFTIDYQILCADIPERIKDSLNIVVEKVS